MDLPPVAPLFPLTQAILLPRTRLPLNIFEPRYLAMVRDALKGNRMIGMIQPLEFGAEVREPDPKLCQVGCLGEILDSRDTADGRILIMLEGICRFRMAREASVRTLYRQANVDYEAFRPDLSPPDTDSGINRDEILRLLDTYSGARAARNIGAVENIRDRISFAGDELLINGIAMMCPFAPVEKQALLEAGSLVERARLLTLLLATADQAGPDSPSVSRH